LSWAGIAHRRTEVRSPRANGFVERFNGTILDAFFRTKPCGTFYAIVEALQRGLDNWLHHDNTESPRFKYRRQWRRPIETINRLVSQDA